MIYLSDLKKIVILSHLNSETIKQIVPHMELLRFEDRQPIFREGEAADIFYMIHHGKVLLEKHISNKITVSVDSIKPGYSFGWSAVLEETATAYSSDAICAEPSEIYAITGEALKQLLEDNPMMGFRFNQRLLQVLKSRLSQRTEQFVRAFVRHPDIQHLMEE